MYAFNNGYWWGLKDLVVGSYPLLILTISLLLMNKAIEKFEVVLKIKKNL